MQLSSIGERHRLWRSCAVWISDNQFGDSTSGAFGKSNMSLSLCALPDCELPFFVAIFKKDRVFKTWAVKDTNVSTDFLSYTPNTFNHFQNIDTYIEFRGFSLLKFSLNIFDVSHRFQKIVNFLSFSWPWNKNLDIFSIDYVQKLHEKKAVTHSIWRGAANII